MNPSESEGNLVFDQHKIRLIIGGIALLLPLIVRIFAGEGIDSISYSYYTPARNLFVGNLFIIGAFLCSYSGHKYIITEKTVGRFWETLGKLWKRLIDFRIKERKHEENLVSWVGGIAAVVTAYFPTNCLTGKDCPDGLISIIFSTISADTSSKIHYTGALIVFSTTVYFCLVAFRGRAKAKLKEAGNNVPKQLGIRMIIYSLCGWGIVGLMLCLGVVIATGFDAIPNIKFWLETVALELFGFAWLIASHYLPLVTDKKERQKLF